MRAGVVASGALVAFATTALATPSLRLGATARDSSVYPAQALHVAMDHALHVEEMGLECTGCHGLAEGSRSARDHLVPNEDVCGECHEGIRQGEDTSFEEACRGCHPGAEGSVEASLLPAATLHFAHETHVVLSECTHCHSRVSVRATATADDLPMMDTCMACHDGQQAPAACATCHPADPDGVLRRDLNPGSPLAPPASMGALEHGPDFMRRHGSVATPRRRECFSCHREHECIACHDGSVRPREVHPGDWLRLHSIEARAGERCQGCHRGQSFCRTCHARAGVAQSGPSGRIRREGPIVHRGDDWAGGASPRHGIEARRALASCVSCHSGQDCVRCHAAVSPHGPGFRRRCRALVAAGSASCVVCHASPRGSCDE